MPSSPQSKSSSFIKIVEPIRPSVLGTLALAFATHGVVTDRASPVSGPSVAQAYL